MSLCHSFEWRESRHISNMRQFMSADTFHVSMSFIWMTRVVKWINESSVNPKSTSNQSSKPCTVLQYPSRKVLTHSMSLCHSYEWRESWNATTATHFSWWVLQHCTGFARLVWGRLRVHRVFVYSDWFVCYVCFCFLLPSLTLLLSFFRTSCTASPARWECL